METSERTDGSRRAAGLPEDRTFLAWRRSIASLAALAVVAVTAIGASGYWTTGDSTATGSGATSTAAGIVVNQHAASTRLYPGSSVALSGDLDNSANASPVYVASVAAEVDTFSEQTDPLKPACTQADFSIDGSATVAAQIPAGVGAGSWSGLSLAMIDSGANQDNCKGVSIPITYTANP